MGFSEFWIQKNNGRKEELSEIKACIRREQIDKKFRNLFDVYDVNQDGTLEAEELEILQKSIQSFAGNDNILDSSENKALSSIFAKELQIENADFQGFVLALNRAGGEIISSEEKIGEDGGKIVITQYNNGLTETLYFYPDGEFKMKKAVQDSESTVYKYSGKSYTKDELNHIIKKEYEESCSAYQDSLGITTLEGFTIKYLESKKVVPETNKFHREELEMSDRAKADASVREFVLSHYIETHQSVQSGLDTMGILDDIGAAVNAGAGELWNSCKNIYNKYFGDGTENDYQNFYELVKNFKPEYEKSISLNGTLETMRKNPELYLNSFRQSTGLDFNTEQGEKFLQITEQYQNAQILKERLNILRKALAEIRMYEAAQDAIKYAPVQNEGLNPAEHLLNANELLLQYFNGDKEAANLILNDTIGNPQRTMEAVKELIEETEKLNNSVLDGRTFEAIREDYINQYKEIYKTDFVPDDLMEKVMDAKATGGMVKIAAITLVSVIITKSPALAGIMRASAGAAVDGAAANVIRTLVSKYGRTTVQQGIKLAMSTGTVATDVALTLLNQITDNRDGIDGEELWESTKGAAKYIYFGSFVGGPIAQAVSGKIGRLGLTGKLFSGGAKSAHGAITTTTITGDKLVENFMKSSKSILAQGGALASEIASFSLLDLATGADDVAMVVEEQGKMLPSIKVMHNLFEYMLGAKTHTAISKANFEAAIERSGIKDWTIKETKTPSGVTYSVDMKGIPLGTFKDVNTLATAMFERVARSYSEGNSSKTSAPEAENVRGSTSETGSEYGVKDATSTNPAENITSRLEGEVYRNEFREEGIRLNTPERLDAELREAENNPNAPKENLEALSIIISGKTNEILAQRYSEMAKILDEIHVKYAKEIAQLETKYGDKPQEYAEHFMKFLAEKMGVAGCEPEIVFTKLEGGDGAYNWSTGQLYISDKITDCKDIKTMIAHEFIHTLQFENILATYGKEGVAELYMKHGNGKLIEDLTKKYVKDEYECEIEELGLTKDELMTLQQAVAESWAEKCLSRGSNPELFKYAQEHPVESGSLNSYMARLQLNNLIKPEEFDTEAYYRSTNETEAYYLGNGQVTGRDNAGGRTRYASESRSQSQKEISIPMGKLEAASPGLAAKLKKAAERFNYELSRNINRARRGADYVQEKAEKFYDKTKRIGKAVSGIFDAETLNIKLKKSGIKDKHRRYQIIEMLQKSNFEDKEVYNQIVSSIKTLKEMGIPEQDISQILTRTAKLENKEWIFNNNSIEIIKELAEIRKLAGKEWQAHKVSTTLLGIESDNGITLANIKEFSATMKEGYSLEDAEFMIRSGVKGEDGRKSFKEILNSTNVQQKSDKWVSPVIIASQYYQTCLNSKGEFVSKNWDFIKQLEDAGIKHSREILEAIKNDNSEITEANIKEIISQLKLKPSEVMSYNYADKLKNCISEYGKLDFERMDDVQALTGLAGGMDLKLFQNPDGSYNKDAIVQLQKLRDAGFDKNGALINIVEIARKNALAVKQEGVILSSETVNFAIELKNKGIEEHVIGSILEHCQTKDGKINTELLNTIEPLAKILTEGDVYTLSTWLFPVLEVNDSKFKEMTVKNIQKLREGGYSLFDMSLSEIITLKEITPEEVINAAIKLKQEGVTVGSLRNNLKAVRMDDGSLNRESFEFLLKLKNEGFNEFDCSDIIRLCTRDNGEFISENTETVISLLKEYQGSKYTGDYQLRLVKILVEASSDKAGVIRPEILKENQSKLDKFFNTLESEDQEHFSYYLELAVTKDGVFDENVFEKINKLKYLEDGISDPNYYKTLHNFIDACRNEDGSFNVDAYNDGIKLVKTYKLTKWNASYIIPVYREFKHLNEKNFVYDLSLQEKRNLQSTLLRYNQKLDELKDLKKNLKSDLIPTTDVEYSALMKQLSQSLGETELKLDEAVVKRLNFDINALSNLTSANPVQEISLKENYDILLKKIQSKMSGLAESEKRKIYDYFGFTVKDGKISGFPSTFGKNIEYTDIKNSFSRKVVDAVTKVIDDFNANNTINVKGEPELSSILTSISKSVPEILNKFSNSSKALEAVNTLKSIIASPEYANLSSDNKTVLILAVLLKDSNAGNTQEMAYTVYNLSAKLNLSSAGRENLFKLLIVPDLISNYEKANPNKLVERFSRMDSYKSNEKEEALDILAFTIKENGVEELSYLLYSSDTNGMMSNELKTALQKRIFEIKKDDFLLPQTSAEMIHSYRGTIRNINGYEVEVVDAKSMNGFYAYAHTPEAGACNHSSRITKFSNFEEFRNVDNNSIICASYVSADKSATWQKHGFLFKVKSGHEYVGMGHDIFSLCKNTTEMLAEYYRNTGMKAFSGKGYKFSHRTFIATQLKDILHVTDNNYSNLIKSSNELASRIKNLLPDSSEYKECQKELYRINQEIEQIDKDYVNRLDRIKTELSSEQFSLEDIRKIDPEFAQAYEKFLARDNTGHKYGKEALMRSDYWNEVLVGNPEIEAIYTKDLSTLPEEYLELAQTKGLKIVLL